MSTSKQYLEELDYTRAVTAFGIFMIHATGGFVLLSQFNSKVMHLGLFLNQFFRFGTPVFMTMAGLVLFYSYRNLQEFKPWEFFKKKVMFLIVPYIIWSTGYFLFKSYMYQVNITAETTLFFLRQLLLGEVHDHLYFIFLIIQFYLLFPILLVTLSGLMKSKPWQVLGGLFVIQGIILVYAFYYEIPDVNWVTVLFSTYYWKSIFGWFFYFLFGGIIAYHYQKTLAFINKNFKMIFAGFLLSTVFFIGEVYFNIATNNGLDYYEIFGSIRPQNLVFAPLAMAMLLWCTSKMKEMRGFSIVGNMVGSVKSLGTYSLGIYFAHPMILEFIKIKLLPLFPEYLGYGRILSLGMFIILAWVLTIALVYSLSMFNWRWLLMGKVPNFKITWFANKLSSKNS